MMVARRETDEHNKVLTPPTFLPNIGKNQKNQPHRVSSMPAGGVGRTLATSTGTLWLCSGNFPRNFNLRLCAGVPAQRPCRGLGPVLSARVSSSRSRIARVLSAGDHRRTPHLGGESETKHRARIKRITSIGLEAYHGGVPV